MSGGGPGELLGAEGAQAGPHLSLGTTPRPALPVWLLFSLWGEITFRSLSAESRAQPWGVGGSSWCVFPGPKVDEDRAGCSRSQRGRASRAVQIRGQVGGAGRAAGRRGAASVDVGGVLPLPPSACAGSGQAPWGELPGSTSCPSPGSWLETQTLRPAPDPPRRPRGDPQHTEVGQVEALMDLGACSSAGLCGPRGSLFHRLFRQI